MTNKFDLLPPENMFNEDAERKVLGAMILYSTALQQALSILRQDSFYGVAHQRLYGAMSELFLQSKAVDLTTLCDHLTALDVLQKVGGRLYIISLMEQVSGPANIKYHCAIVREKSLYRKLWRACLEGLSSAKEGGLFSETLTKVGSSIFALARDEQENQDHATDLFARLNTPMSSGLMTGFTDVDRLLGGLAPGGMYTIGGRPSLGKTALAIQVAVNATLEGQRVLIYSFEMMKEAIENRIICAVAGLNTHEVFATGYTEQHQLVAMQVMDKLQIIQDNLIIVDKRLSPIGLLVNSKLHLQRDGINLFVLDYLQRFSVTEDVKDVSYASKVVKDAALEMGVPFLVLSQLSRSSEYRADKRPEMQDLRDSGAIEQDSDVVGLMHNPAIPLLRKNLSELTVEDQELMMRWKNKIEVNFVKNRNGPVGMVMLGWRPEYTRFENLSFRQDVAPLI